MYIVLYWRKMIAKRAYRLFFDTHYAAHTSNATFVADRRQSREFLFFGAPSRRAVGSFFFFMLALVFPFLVFLLVFFLVSFLIFFFFFFLVGLVFDAA